MHLDRFRAAGWLMLGVALWLARSVTAAEPPVDDKPVKLFDGKSLEGWKIANFGGEGEVEVEDGVLYLDMGNDMTGITWAGEFPKTNYEVTLEAQRVAGGDFFCGMTFPAGDSPCTLIVGGWGGAVVGLSSIDGSDASDNETTSIMSFDDKKWYRIRLRVTDERIDAWIGDEQVVKFNLAGHSLSIRGECELNKPFGFATWRTTAGLRNIELRRIKPE